MRYLVMLSVLMLAGCVNAASDQCRTSSPLVIEVLSSSTSGIFRVFIEGKEVPEEKVLNTFAAYCNDAEVIILADPKLTLGELSEISLLLKKAGLAVRASGGFLMKTRNSNVFLGVPDFNMVVKRIQQQENKEW